ncbi:MAG: hypothetical protein ACWA5W_09475 [Phycisphaerales bacterium]
MKPSNETIWWIDFAGSTHINSKPAGPKQALAMGVLYTDSKAGVITHFKDQPAQIALVSRALLDVLHAQFPGTRWWIKDPVPAPTPSHQTAS